MVRLSTSCKPLHVCDTKRVLGYGRESRVLRSAAEQSYIALECKTAYTHNAHLTRMRCANQLPRSSRLKRHAPRAFSMMSRLHHATDCSPEPAGGDGRFFDGGGGIISAGPSLRRQHFNKTNHSTFVHSSPNSKLYYSELTPLHMLLDSDLAMK